MLAFTRLRTLAILLLITAAPLASADFVGLQAPPWARASAATAYADFDSFAGFVLGTGTVVPTAQVGASSAALGQSTVITPPGGLFAGGDRLYVFDKAAQWTLDTAVGFDVTHAILQIKESQGSGLAAYTLTLNGLAPTAFSVFDDGGAPADAISRYYWDLTGLAIVVDQLTFLLSGPANSHTSFDAFSLDLAAAPVPVPAAAWLFGSALVGLAARRRRA